MEEEPFTPQDILTEDGEYEKRIGAEGGLTIGGLWWTEQHC